MLIILVYLSVVELHESLEHLRVGFVQNGIDLAEVLDHGEVVALPHSVVVREAVVSAPHDVEGGQVAPGELHGAEQVVPHVGAEDCVLALADLRGQTHDDLLQGSGLNLILAKKNRERRSVRFL